MSIMEYIERNDDSDLCADVWRYLCKDHDPEKYPEVRKLYRKNKVGGDFFYEGTIRAQIAHFLDINLPKYEPQNYKDWIVISEQKYGPAILGNWRADILIQNLKTPSETIIIEVKSDMNDASSMDDANKFLQGLQNGLIMQKGYVFFVCPLDADKEDWIKRINKSVGDDKRIKAIGIYGVAKQMDLLGLSTAGGLEIANR